MLEREEDHFVGKVAQKALIIRGDEVLLVRHVGSLEVWELPGGRLNINEDPKAGLAREIVEELGVEISVADVMDVDQFVMKRTNEPHIAVVYKAFLSDTEAVLKIDSTEVTEVAWVTGKTWINYQVFDNYRRVLETHFKELST